MWDRGVFLLVFCALPEKKKLRLFIKNVVCIFEFAYLLNFLIINVEFSNKNNKKNYISLTSIQNKCEVAKVIVLKFHF